MTIMSAIDIENCTIDNTIRSCCPAFEPPKRPYAASDGENEVIYHAGYSAAAIAIATTMHRIHAMVAILSCNANEQVTSLAIDVS